MAAPTHQQLVADLKRAYPRQPVETETLRVYLRELSDIPASLLEPVVRELIRTTPFFPAISEIRALAAERTLALPGEAEALAQIETRIRETRNLEPPSVLHPLVRRALDMVGGFHAFRRSEDPSVIRGQFGRLYRELRAAAINEARVGTLELPPGRRELTT